MPSSKTIYGRQELVEIVVGGVLLFTGWILAFLMTIRVIAPDIYLSILSYFISIVGLGLSMHGFVTMFSARGKREAG
ncbi:MAG: hypothetical protein ACP5KA_05695 [Desulfurococcaceae archaeon]